MKKYGRILALAFAIVLGAWSSLLAQDNVDELVKSAPPRGKFPEASAVVVDAVQTLVLNRDGSKTEDFFRLVEIFNVQGREKFSDFRIPFDKNTDTVEILTARTYKGDRTSLEVERGAINDLTPPHLADADIYSNIIHRVLSFPAVDPGVCLAVRYRKTSRELPGNLDQIVFFQTDEPLLRKKLKVILPAGKSLRYALVGLPSAVSEETAGEEKTYTIVVADSPQVKPEEYMPPRAELFARAVLSTYGSWDEATDAFRSSFFEAAQPDESVRAAARDILKGETSRDEMIKKLFLFTARDIRSVRLDLGEGGYKVLAASTVLKNRYGDGKDKSALLAALLGAAGIEAYPVLVHSEAVPLVEDVPTLRQFDRVLVAVPEGDDYLYLNPFADDSLYGFFEEGRGAKGLVLKPRAVEFRIVRGRAGTDSVSRGRFEAEIGTNGSIRGSLSLELSGLFDARARQELKDQTAPELERFFAEAVNKVLGEGRVLKTTLSDTGDLGRPVSIRQEFRGDEFAVFQGKVMLINLPQSLYGFAELPSYPSLAKRLYPFRVSDLAETEIVVALKIPAGYKPLYLPEGFSQKTDYGEFVFRAAFDPAARTVRIERVMRFAKKEIPVEAYPEFKKVWDAFGGVKNNLILLEK